MNDRRMNKVTWVEYSKAFSTFEEAVKAAKELSYSLADSWLPDMKQNFENFCFMEFEAYCLERNANPDSEKWLYTFPENLTNGDPVCEVQDGNVYTYVTTGYTKFSWWDDAKICIVQMSTASPRLADSGGYKSAVQKGWQPSLSVEGEEVNEMFPLHESFKKKLSSSR